MSKTNRNRLRYREQTDGSQRGGRLGDWLKKGERIKKYKLVVTK